MQEDDDCLRINSRQRLTFNVSGTMFETWSDTLDKYPTTLLGDRNKLWLYYCSDTQEYFFNRNRLAFEAILYFYQSNGRLVRPPNISMEVFENECAFFEIPELSINTMKEKEGFVSSESALAPLIFPHDIQGKIWMIFDKPQSSRFAFVWNAISMTIIALWIILFCAETVVVQNISHSNSWWFYIDMTFTSFFTMEYLLRFFTVPTYRILVTDFMKVVDFAASLPYLILLSINATRRLAIMNFLRLLRLLRFIRLLKLFSSSSRVNLLKRIMASSVNDIGLLFLCLIMVVLVGASILYFLEMGTKETQFTSVPESAWWAIQTVVVLGYGDMIPKSDSGKVFAAFFMIFGALTISLPVLSVVTKLVRIYGKE